MKALLYKDLLVLTKQMKFFLVMVALFCLLPNEFNMGSFFVVYSGIFIPVSLLAYDERARWDTLAAMLPYTTRDLVASRYVMGWGCLVFATVFWLIGQGINEGGFLLIESLILVSVTLLFMALAFPVFFRLGTEKARLYVIVGCLVLAVAVAGGGTLLERTAMPFLALDLLFLAPLLLLVAVAASLVSIRVCMQQYEARKW